MQDGLYIETEDGPQRLGLRDERHDAEILNRAKQAGSNAAVEAAQLIAEVAPQAQAEAQRQLLFQAGENYLRKNPDLITHRDLLAYEVQNQPYDKINDPYAEKVLEEAGRRVRLGLSRLDKMEVDAQQSAHQHGLTLTPDGRLLEGFALDNPQVEEAEGSGDDYASIVRRRRNNIRKTISNTGEA